MNINHMLSLALTGLMATTAAATAADDTPERGAILQSLNMFTPDQTAPAYKAWAYEHLGTEWAVDMAYGYWSAHHQPAGELDRANHVLIHAQLNQRIIQDDVNGGTWLRVEFSGSWGLDHKSADKHYDVFNHGGVYGSHSDYFGPHQGLLPEVALMHYFAGKRACIIAGMVNMTNYFDAVGIANDSFANFTHNTFVNSSVLPLPDSNIGAVLQVELTPADYVMLGVSRTGATFGHNPLTGGPDGFCVVGEYGHVFADSGVTLRITPFVNQLDAEECADGRRHRNAGVAASVEYAPTDNVTFFARAGLGAKTSLGTAAEFSCGAVAHLTPSRPDDALGVAFGVTKARHTADDEAYNRRETVMEATYSFQVTDNFKLMPHIQYIHDPAYRAGHGDEVVGGVQAVLSF